MGKLSRKSKLLSLALLLFGLLIATLIFINPSNSQQENIIDRLKTFYDGQNIKAELNSNAFDLEVARSPNARSRGLMFREIMQEQSGMIFIFDEPKILSFYMKNTYIPLDIIFVDEDLKIINIHKNTTPLNSEILYKSTKPAIIVVELNANITEKYSISEGSQIQFILE